MLIQLGTDHIPTNRCFGLHAFIYKLVNQGPTGNGGHPNKLCVCVVMRASPSFLRGDYEKKQTKTKTKKQVILSALCPLLCNSMWPQHTLQMFADN